MVRIHLPRQAMQVQSLDQEDPLEKEMATHSSVLAWEIPWAEESGGLQFIGSQRAGHDLVIKQQYERTSRIAGIVYFSNLNYSNFYLKNTFLEN